MFLLKKMKRGGLSISLFKTQATAFERWVVMLYKYYDNISLVTCVKKKLLESRSSIQGKYFYSSD